MQRIGRGARYLIWALVGTLTHPRLVAAMWQFECALPGRMNSPLPELMNGLTPRARDLRISPESVRRIADAIAAWDVRSPLGLCLRRSLVRYFFLRRAGVNVVIHFGARLKEEKKIGGHAWLTLDGQPYYEDSENYRGFAVLYSHPAKPA